MSLCRNLRNRLNGKIKPYPCEYCNKLCFKKTKRALCSFECRILGNIKKIDDCWIWLGKKNRDGYGEIMIDGKRRRLTRLVYEFYKNPLSENKYVCHTCDIPACINPNHLWEGTNQENQIDRIKKINIGSIKMS